MTILKRRAEGSKAFDLRHSGFVIPSSFVLTHSSFSVMIGTNESAVLIRCSQSSSFDIRTSSFFRHSCLVIRHSRNSYGP